jgi:hypothetical protein
MQNNCRVEKIWVSKNIFMIKEKAMDGNSMKVFNYIKFSTQIFLKEHSQHKNQQNLSFHFTLHD